MSVALTTPQVIARSKTVTRRDGWWEDKNGKRMLKPGDRLTLCPKVTGFRRGEHPERLVDVEILSVRRERLDAITASEVAAEGFPGQAPVIWGLTEGVHDVYDELLKCPGVRGGRGYLLPSITQTPRRFDVRAAGCYAWFAC